MLPHLTSERVQWNLPASPLWLIGDLATQSRSLIFDNDADEPPKI